MGEQDGSCDGVQRPSLNSSFHLADGRTSNVLQEMKIVLLALFLIIPQLHGDDLRLGYYSVMPEKGELGLAPIFALRDRADREIIYGNDKDYDLGLGKVTDGSRSPIYHSFGEIQRFLEQERHKEMVVVWFEKFLMTREESVRSERVKEVINQMQQVGYKRVVILGMSSTGVHYVADTELNKNKQKKPEMATPRKSSD